MAKKKEKKILEKQLMYEQMLTQQLYGGQPSREEGIAKLQSEYDAWNARQDGIAKLQSDYDNWLNEQQKMQQPVEAPKVEVAEAPKAAPVQKTVTKKAQPTQVPALKEEKKYLTHADILPSITKANVEKQMKRNEQTVQKKANEDASISKIAKQLGITEDEVRQRMSAPQQELNTYDEKKIDNDLTEKLQAASAEEKRKASQKKYNPWEAFTGRFAKATTDIVNAPIAIAGKLTGKNWSLYNDAQKQEFKDLKEQHPAASTAGDLAGMAFAAYATGGGSAGTMAKEGAANAGQVFNALKDEAILNGASKGVAATQALKGALPTLATNAASNMPTDFVVDIIPTLANDIAEGEKSDGEIIRDTLLNTGINYGFNTIGDAISLGKAMKNMGNPVTADDAFRANALEGYENLKNYNSAEDAAKNINAQSNVPKTMPHEGKIYLDDSDISDYLNSGKRRNINKAKAYNEGKKITLADRNELRDFLYGDNSNYADTVSFGRISDSLANDIEKTSNGKIDDLYGGYLEIEKNHAGHSIDNHSAPKEAGDLPLNEEDLITAFENTNNAKVLDVKRYPSGERSVTIGIPSNDGHVIMIETASKSRGSLLYRNGWKVDNDKFIDKFLRSNPNSAESISSTPVRDGITPYMDNVTDSAENVNKNSVNFELRPHAKNQGVSPAIENEAKRLAEAMDAEELAEETAKSVEQGIDNAARNLSVEEVNLKGGKKGYYVAENSGSVSRNVENGKVYKTPEEAQEALESMAKEQPVSKAPEVATEPVPRNMEEIEPSVEDMVESGQSRHIRGAGEMNMEGISDEVVADFQDNPQMHSVLRNADTKAKAESIYNTSNNPEVEFRDMLRRHDPAALPLGHQIAKDYSAAGNHEAAAQIYREMGEQLTKAGQFSQAAVINMMKNDPLTALQYAQRQLDTLNEQGLKRFGSKWNDFKLTDDEIKLFDNITPGDEDAIKAAYDMIGERLGKEYPTSFMDKLLEGRKIAMLFNVRTNVRNFGANVPTLGMRWAADRVEALGQNVAHLINPNFKVTQAVTGSGIQGRKLATEAFNSPRVQTMLEGTSGKYEIPDLKNSLVKNKQMYKGNRLEKWIDNLTGGGIQKINEKLFGKKGVQSGLETVRNATYKLLDLGDSPFVKENFIERLGSYINAQKIKNLDDIPDEAIELAWDEAMKATYKDESWAVKMLSKIKGGMESVPVVGRPISQGAIPFLQAPGNIAARMVDYSPIRGSKGVADIISGARANDLQKVTRGIEEASKGLTGTGMVLLGMKLRESGILTGTYSKDKDQKAFEKQNGFKEFALHIGDKYFTYDWAQPFAQSLITGTLLEDAIEKSDENNSDLLAYIDEKAGTNFNGSMASKVTGVAGEAAKASLNSWFNASPLQGLQELLSGNYTDKDDIASSIKQTLVDDFAGAFVPSAVNAVAKSADPVQRNTTDKTNSTATFVNQQIAKIPGLSKTLPAKYDTWGREMKYADNKAMAAASRFVIPGDYSYDKSDKVDKEINRLYKASNNAAVFPQVAPTKVNGETLSNKEVSEYQKDMGERSHQFVEELISTDFYKGMTNKDMAETVSKLYGVSKALTERDKFGKELADSSEYKKPIAEYDNAGGGKEGAKAVIKYYQGKQIASEAGISTNSKAYESIQNNIKQGDMDAAKKVAENEKQAKDAFVEYGVENNSTSRKIYEKYGDTGLKDLSELQKKGLGTTATYTYQSAKKELGSSIPSITDFATTYNKIDTSRNGSIDQKEFKKYLNKINPSQAEAERLATIYGDWKHAPKLNKKGEWYFPTK